SGAASGEGHLLDITDEMKKRLQKQAEGVTIPFLLRWIRAFADADAALRSTVYGQLPLEMAFAEATLPTETATSQPATKEKDPGSEIAEDVAPVRRMPEQDEYTKP